MVVIYNQGLSDDRAAAVKEALVKEVSMLAKLLQLDLEKLLQFLLTTLLLVKH
jgi:outer membrane protein OmpA-like peptidoglycan-associated protein